MLKAMFLLQCIRGSALVYRQGLVPALPMVASRVIGMGRIIRPGSGAAKFSTTASPLPVRPEAPMKPRKIFKVRQHVNPLASSFQVEIPLEEGWLATAFAKPINKEMIVDIGCAKGTWALTMCKSDPGINVLGLEIRKPMVQNCLIRKQSWGLTNVHFLSCNANVNIHRILTDIHKQGATVGTVTIQFPDPQFKERHKKRRLVNATFVQNLSSALQEGTRVFMQSDVKELLEDMISHFLDSPYFTPAQGYDSTCLEGNKSAFPVRTEREIATLANGLPVYRMMFIRNALPTVPI
jgi:tRNA (guanine-N7-)-methyltransferase